jgi:serralysin
MANIQISASVNMYASQVWYGTVLSHDASHITVAAGAANQLVPGGLEAIYTGNFTYSNTGEVYGTLTGYTSLLYGIQQFTASGLSVSANDAMHLINAGLLQSFYQTALAGNDQFAVTGGTHLLDGYGGYNTVTEMFGLANYSITSSGGATLVSSAFGNDTLYNFQRVDFADGSYDTFSHNFTFSASTGTFVGSASVIDTVIVPDLFEQNHLVGVPSGSATLSGPAISDTLIAVDRLQFVDGTMYYDVGSPAAMVARLYQAALGRASDPLGLAAWTAQLQGGASITQLASDFISSPEFNARFPGASQNATAFVTQLYANVLHRTPDPAGLTSWVSQLQSGVLTQAQVLGGFSESAENQTNMQPVTSGGIWVADEQAASVARLYYSALNRAPDAAGLIYWTGLLKTGTQLTQEASSFMSSPEFQAKYGTLNNSDFVDLLYLNVLGRSADQAGQSSWTTLLNSGQSRATVLVGFSESSEHQGMLISKIESSGVVAT